MELDLACTHLKSLRLRAKLPVRVRYIRQPNSAAPHEVHDDSALQVPRPSLPPHVFPPVRLPHKVVVREEPENQQEEDSLRKLVQEMVVVFGHSVVNHVGERSFIDDGVPPADGDVGGDGVDVDGEELHEEH